MTQPKLLLLTVVTMVAFAGNSLLCRMALATTQIDPATFTTVRMVSGALMLLLLVSGRRSGRPAGNWLSALALFAYAALLSFAYIHLPTGTGALLLFGAVQASMIGYGLFRGERLGTQQVMALALALGGLVGLLLPGIEAPPLGSSLLMLGSGVAWGVYSLRGRGAAHPTRETAGNFLRSVPMTLAVSLVLLRRAQPDAAGLLYAVASGALASGLGYAIWYSVLPRLRATTAATVQLSAPALASVGGVIFIGEPITLRLLLASVAILGGIAWFILSRTASSPPE